MVSLNEDIDASSESPEDMLIALLDKATYDQDCAEQVKHIRNILTEKQFWRVWKAYAEKLPVDEIAVLENTGEHSIYATLKSAKKKIFKNFSFDKKTLSKKS